MIAAFLQNADGSFAFGRLVISLVVVFLLIGLAFIILPRAIRTGRIDYITGWGLGGRTTYIEREKQPAYFWFIFAIYCLFMLFMLNVVIECWLGWGHGFI
jgi:hypothetical protein